MHYTEDALQKLVNVEEGKISRQIFVDDAIFKQEMEQIFQRAWLFVGHEGQIPKPDDYVVSRMAQESVILTRDRQGQVHVLLNTCTHRGMKLCRYDQGNTRTFTCPYHGWSFSTDGKLVSVPGALHGVPGFTQHYHSELDKSQWGLVRVPRVEVYKGTVWANWDVNAPSLEDYLGDMRLYLDFALDHRDGSSGGSTIFGGVQKWRIPCNWKFPAENFIGDLYHDVTHRSVDMVGISPGGGKGRRDTSRPDLLTIGFEHLGHGVIGWAPHYSEPEYIPLYAAYPEVADYYRQVYEKRKEALEDKMRVVMSVGTIFPSMSFHGLQPRTIAVFHPISATETEMWRFFLMDEDAPEAVKDATRAYFLRYSGPGGMTESDDLENWGYATQASIGPNSKNLPYNYQMGIGHARPVPGMRGAIENGDYTEENARIYYRRWRSFMSGHGWDALMAPSRASQVEA